MSGSCSFDVAALFLEYLYGGSLLHPSPLTDERRAFWTSFAGWRQLSYDTHHTSSSGGRGGAGGKGGAYGRAGGSPTDGGAAGSVGGGPPGFGAANIERMSHFSTTLWIRLSYYYMNMVVFMFILTASCLLIFRMFGPDDED